MSIQILFRRSSLWMVKDDFILVTLVLLVVWDWSLVFLQLVLERILCGSEFIREKKEIGGNADKSTGKDENQKSNKEIQNLKEGEVDVCWDTREFKSHLRPCDVCLLSDLDP